MNEIKQLIADRKSLQLTLVLSVLYSIPLVLANYDYLDDMGRNLRGYGWQHDGRFIATLLGKLWSVNGTIVSVYPFSLFLSVLILGFTGYLLTVFSGLEKEHKLKWSSLLVVTSPAFLGNLVFKYDCLPMALSLLVVVLPFAFYATRLRFATASVMGIFLSLGLYQSSATVFFIVGSLFLIRELANENGRSFFINSGLMAGSFILAFLGHIGIIRIWKLPVSDRTRTIFGMPQFMELLEERNARFIERIDLLMRSGWYAFLVYLFLIVCLSGLLYYLYAQKRFFKAAALVPAIAVIMLVDFWLIAGVNIIMKDSYWDLRTFCGLGFFLVTCMSFQRYLGGVWARAGRCTAFLLVVFSFVLMAQFGKALQNQKEFQTAVAGQLDPYFKDSSVKKAGFVGTLTIAPKNRFMYSVYPLFENLLSSPVGKHSAWSKEALNTMGTWDAVEIINSDHMECAGELVEKAPYYHVRTIGNDTVIIDFNKTRCN